METRNEILAAGLVSRAIALALAVFAATFVSLGSAAVVTRGASEQVTVPAQQAGVDAETKEIRFG